MSLIIERVLMISDTPLMIGDILLKIGDTPSVNGDTPLMFCDTLLMIDGTSLIIGDTPSMNSDIPSFICDTLGSLGQFLEQFRSMQKDFVWPLQFSQPLLGRPIPMLTKMKILNDNWFNLFYFFSFQIFIQLKRCHIL